MTQNRRLCHPHGLCDVQVCSWRSARLDPQRLKFAFAVVQTCTSASATLHNAECNLAFWRVLTCTDASPLGQSPDPLGNVGIPALECRATDSDGVGLPTGAGSADRHVLTRYADSRKSVYRPDPTRYTDFAYLRASIQYLPRGTSTPRYDRINKAVRSVQCRGMPRPIPW